LQCYEELGASARSAATPSRDAAPAAAAVVARRSASIVVELVERSGEDAAAKCARELLLAALNVGRVDDVVVVEQ